MMSEETSSPVQKRAVSANSSSADTSTSNSQRKADEMVLEVGHDSPHMTPIDSQKIKFQENDSSNAKKLQFDAWQFGKFGVLISFMIKKIARLKTATFVLPITLRILSHC